MIDETTQINTISNDALLPQAITASTPTPTPTPNAQIVCFPTNGSDIKAGFYCVLNNTQATTTQATTTILTFDYNGQQWQTAFVDVWRPADVVISVFLGFICFFIIIKTILSIVIKKRVSIYKKVDK